MAALLFGLSIQTRRPTQELVKCALQVPRQMRTRRHVKLARNERRPARSQMQCDFVTESVVQIKILPTVRWISDVKLDACMMSELSCMLSHTNFVINCAMIHSLLIFTTQLSVKTVRV